MRRARDLADARSRFRWAPISRRSRRRSRRKQWDAIEAVVAKFQRTAMRLRHSLVPTVCAVRGMALGGSCEFIMHADRTVAALESYIGLVEVGVGLLPAGGGSKEFVVRAAEEVRRGANGSQIDQFPFIRTYFQTIATATVAKSALEAKELGYLRPSDIVVMNALRTAARGEGRGASAGGSRLPAAAARAQRAGRGQDRLRDAADDARQHARRRVHQRRTISRSASAWRACCAAAKSKRAAWSTRSGCSTLERAEFMALLRNEQTQARIAHTLATGKPLRN